MDAAHPGEAKGASQRVRLFPLPYFTHAEAHACTSPAARSARVHHRRQLAQAVTVVTNRCILTLNRMYHSHADLPAHIIASASHDLTSHTRKQATLSHPSLRVTPRLHASLSASATRQQQRLLLSIRSQCAHFVRTAVRPSASHADPSVGSTRTNQTTLRNLIRNYSVAETQSHTGSPDQPSSIEGHLPPASPSGAAAPSRAPFSTAATAVVPLLAHRVALPEDLHIVPLSSVLPPDMARAYCDPSQAAALLRPPIEIFALDVAAPLKPARVAGSRTEYTKLIGRMLEAGMIRFTSTPRAVNGVFTVGKDADADRLIIDAQPANRLFVDSPHVALPNPSHLTQLRVPRGARLQSGKSDLSNFYHHLGLPEWMVDYFALPPLTAAELAQLGLPADACFPACLTLPMGFSHAVPLAQGAHLHVVYSSGALSPSDNILEMRSPDVTADSVKHGIIVDDLFLFSLDHDLATAAFQRVLAAYAAAGFVVKPSKVVLPSDQPLKVIGFVIGLDADNHTSIALSSDACQDLAQTTLFFLSRGVATGLQLAHIIGRWTWCMLLRRPSLAVLQHAYRYIEVAGRRRFTIWPSVRRELWMLLGLLPLLHARLDVDLFHNLLASDASEEAAGVVCTRLTPDIGRRVWQLCSSKEHVNLQTILNAAGQRGDTLAADAAAALSQYSSFYSDVLAARWSTIISSPWRVSEHINALELRAVLLALHWLLSYPSSHSSRVYLLVDSTVTLYSLWKGRSSSAPLLLILRRINALLLASGISLLTGWLPSAVNPADAPSRPRPLPPPLPDPLR